jgi:hypothetical protein
MKISTLPQRFVTLLTLLLLGFSQSTQAQNLAFEARRLAYNNAALAQFNASATCIQAYDGLQVDQPTLNGIVSTISTNQVVDFNIVQLVRVLFLSNGQYDSLLLPALNSIPFWINHSDTVRNFWSENHMIMWTSSDWLLHEKYGRTIDSTLHDRLLHYLQLKNQYGFYEFNSSVYAPYALSGLLNLADFAVDTTIKSLATSAAERLLKEEILLYANDRGVFFPTAGRNYYGKYDTPYGHNHNSLIWLLTGLGPMPTEASHCGAFMSTSSIPVDDIINSWHADEDRHYVMGHTLDSGFALNASQVHVDRVVFQWSSGAYFHPAVALETGRLIEDYNMWDHVDFATLKAFVTFFPVDSFASVAAKLSFMSQSSVISKAQLSVFKRGGVTLSSVRDFWPGKVGYQQFPWMANAGTTAVYTASGTPNSDWYARPEDNNNAHLPFVEQTHNIALIMYWPEVKTSLFHGLLGVEDPTVGLHFRDADFDEVIEDSLWLIGRQADDYVAVRRPCIDTVNGVRACTLDSTDGQAWVCVVGDSTMYGSFAHFQDLISQSQFAESWYHNGVDQWMYWATFSFDTTTVAHAWGRDSLLTARREPVLADGETLKLYPNPARDRVSIEGELPEVGPVSLRLMDLNGRVLVTRVLHHAGGVFHSELDLRALGLAGGMYGLVVRSGRRMDFLKVVVE